MVLPDHSTVPIYTVTEAAHYIRLPRTTLAAWVHPDSGVIAPAEHPPARLSFLNLVEAFVLSAIRRTHQIPLQRVRKALNFVQESLGVPHPLANEVFKTDGVSLFVEHMGQLIEANANGQIMMREVLEGHLQRIEWRSGLAARVYPIVRASGDQPKTIMIDPEFGFGRPVIANTGIRIEALVERYMAGETIPEIAEDYGVPAESVDDAIRSEVRAAA